METTVADGKHLPAAPASAESFFKTRTFQVRNESLPDLSRSLDFDSSRGQIFIRKLLISRFPGCVLV
ncbi:hypothetical protein BaRGS_00030261 [Batillaria attramentaria]|uniref:Uncharacterized protein n=1 Tax=Batillaria attramentaria TaxID=370345 RepID=A0ABD0JV18_9CAEN